MLKTANQSGKGNGEQGDLSGADKTNALTNKKFIIMCKIVKILKQNHPNEMSKTNLYEKLFTDKSLEYLFEDKNKEYMLLKEICENLEEKGFTYQANGNVYFDVSKFPNYTELSHKVLDDLNDDLIIDDYSVSSSDSFCACS